MTLMLQRSNTLLDKSITEEGESRMSGTLTRKYAVPLFPFLAGSRPESRRLVWQRWACSPKWVRNGWGKPAALPRLLRRLGLQGHGSSRGFANVHEAAAARWALNGRVFSPSIHVG